MKGINIVIITEKIKNMQKQKNLSLRQLAKILNYGHGGLSNMINGKSPFPEELVQKLLPMLGISREEFESWALADKYSREVLELAIKNKKEFPYKRKRLLATKIDAVLREKGWSRTILSKEINYSQSGLNRMIMGKINMSKSVIERISNVLGIPQDEVLSWSIADRYDLSLLELTLIPLCDQ